MLRLGHIDYANCLPVHALLLDEAPRGVCLRTGIPSALNAELAEGTIDVAPSSSIEYARNADRYRLLPDLAIGSRGRVRSILLETARAPAALDGATVALPTASATSVVLLRALLELRLGVRPRYRWFDQDADGDPFTERMAAALWIGDRALRRPGRTDRPLVDLGAEWHDWTGLPFVYAVWQTTAGPERDPELAALYAALVESRAFFRREADALAERYADRYGLAPPALLDYWQSLHYRLDGSMVEGLRHFYDLAVRLEEAPAVPELYWTPRSR